VDVRDPGALATLMRQTVPEAVVVTAAMTDVEACEADPVASYEVNVQGTANVVAAARRVGARVVLLSTDYVFDGQAGPYRESDPVRPISTYGLHKVFAELHVVAHAPRPLVVRTTVVYGRETWGKNFVARLSRELAAGLHIRVPDDQVGTPTYAPDLARAIVACLSCDISGIVHVVGNERMTRLEFALRAARALGLDCSLIEGVGTDALRQRAARPRSAGLVPSHEVAALGITMRGVEEGIADMTAGAP
jgi:dTDP-4-dehydrorhamnose reductase